MFVRVRDWYVMVLFEDYTKILIVQGVRLFQEILKCRANHKKGTCTKWLKVINISALFPSVIHNITANERDELPNEIGY